MRAWVLAPVLLAAIGWPAAEVRARERLSRRIDVFAGLQTPSTWALAQDARGFVWIGSTGGLARYDGQEILPWAHDLIPRPVTAIRAAADGTVYVVDHAGWLFRIDGERTTAVADERGRVVDTTDVLPLDDDLWIAAGGRLRRLGRDGRWSPPVEGVHDVNLVRAGPDGAIYAASERQIWRLASDTSAEPVADGNQIADLLVLPDRSLRVVQSDGHVRAIAGGITTELLVLDARGLTLVQRGATLWASFDDALVALRPGEPPEVLRREEGIRSCGPLLVDREGALWAGTNEGITVFPEPDTVSWTFSDGLAKFPRFVAETDEGIWTGAWWGLGRIDGRSGSAHAEPDYTVRGRPCVDGAGHLWAVDTTSIVERADRHFRRYPFPEGAHGFPWGCTSAPDGGVWMVLADGLFHVAAGTERPVAVVPPARIDPGNHGGILTSHQDRRGRLWIPRDERACWADLSRPITAGDWTCASLPGTVDIVAIAETDRGAIWAGSWDGGVWRFDEATGSWSPIPGSRALATRHVETIAPSPRGGVWLVGQGVLVRVADRPDLADGWEVLETLGTWSGLPSPLAEDLLEEPDGSLWIAGAAGVIYLPASARDARSAAPPVQLIDIRVDGQRHAPSTTLDLPYRTNRLELDFAALSFRDPRRVRYRVRLGHDAAWSEPTAQPSFRFVDLAPGAYQAEVSASLDAVTWSSVPASFRFQVGRPWYLQTWAISLAAALVAAALFAAHRIRVAMHVRLERQRATIAMDLHDEMGSGLGSIGILAAVAGDQTLPDTKRRGAVAEIIDAAEDLGESLGDIVWSLRRESSTMDVLIAHIVERGTRLLSDGKAELRTELPSSVPALPMSLTVCRGLQMICFEALHNAARHADARSVTFGLARAGRRRWRIWIEDDGVGLRTQAPSSAGDAPRPTRGGLGLASMRRRAKDIGAALRITPRAAGGTTIEATFDPGMPRDRVPPSHDRARARRP